MEQIINLILGQINPVQTNTTVSINTVQEKVKLVQTLESLPTSHQFISDFHTEEVKDIETLIDYMEGVGFTEEQVKVLDKKMNEIIDKMETEVKSKMSGLLGGLLPNLSSLIR